MDDVAVEKDRHSEETQHPGRVLGCEILKGEGDRIKHNGWQRHREKEKRQRKGEHPEELAAEVPEDEPHEDDDEGAAHEKVFDCDGAEEQHANASQEDGKANPASTRREST